MLLFWKNKLFIVLMCGLLGDIFSTRVFSLYLIETQKAERKQRDRGRAMTENRLFLT